MNTPEVTKKGGRRYKTLRQRRAIAFLAENGGNVSAAMRAAGYSKISAATPKKLTTSKSFAELAEEFLPDNMLLKVHTEGLQATRIHTSHTEPDQEVPDYLVRHKYLQTGYQVKGRIKENGGVAIQFNIGDDRQRYA